ncbi:hypothetical protein C8R43DRAFT_1109988 [Mycena crocata]|nr:hypothetical protein C8R43DRAFT_1109988 [Mycena crocata]
MARYWWGPSRAWCWCWWCLQLELHREISTQPIDTGVTHPKKFDNLPQTREICAEGLPNNFRINAQLIPFANSVGLNQELCGFGSVKIQQSQNRGDPRRFIPIRSAESFSGDFWGREANFDSFLNHSTNSTTGRVTRDHDRNSISTEGTGWKGSRTLTFPGLKAAKRGPYDLRPQDASLWE